MENQAILGCKKMSSAFVRIPSLDGKKQGGSKTLDASSSKQHVPNSQDAIRWRICWMSSFVSSSSSWDSWDSRRKKCTHKVLVKGQGLWVTILQTNRQRVSWVTSLGLPLPYNILHHSATTDMLHGGYLSNACRLLLFLLLFLNRRRLLACKAAHGQVAKLIAHNVLWHCRAEVLRFCNWKDTVGLIWYLTKKK